jgi:plastocyanin
MVLISSLFGAAFLSLALAIPLPEDSAIGDEVAVSAPNGIVMSDTAEASTATATLAPPPPPPPSDQGSSGGSSSSPPYGSGSMNWGGGSGFDDCVSKCMATYGTPPSAYMPTATSDSSGSTSTGTGTTHQVIVAPSQGVLRYVPFAINASVGDTIMFMWGANNHTVTKSSQLLPCNKSIDTPFTSGPQSKDFVFTQVVNSTDPTFFYCGIPNHCQKGMFGIINPPSAITSSGSVLNSLGNLSTQNPDVSAMVAFTNQKTAGNVRAANWGNSIDMTDLPTWAHQHIAENTLYTRTFLAANPKVLGESGAIDLSAAGSDALMIPQDITVALNAAATTTPGSSATSTDASSPTNSAQPSSTSTANTSRAGQLTSPSVLLAVMAVVVTFFAL